MREILVQVNGNFSRIDEKKEYIPIETRENARKNFDGVVGHEYVARRKHSNNITCFTEHINHDKSVHDENFGYVGSIKKLEEGFFSNSGYQSSLFKTEQEAVEFLKEEAFKKIQNMGFGFLAQKQFWFTKNYLENENGVMDKEFIVDKLMKDCYGENRYINNNKEIAKSIVENYFNANIVGYEGQGGYIVGEALSLEQSAAEHKAACGLSQKDIQESIYDTKDTSVGLGVK